MPVLYQLSYSQRNFFRDGSGASAFSPLRVAGLMQLSGECGHLAGRWRLETETSPPVAGEGAAGRAMRRGRLSSGGEMPSPQASYLHPTA